MIDTHCHLFASYFDDIDEVIKRAKDAGVSMIIVNGCDQATNEEVLDLVARYDIVYGALGIQPDEVKKASWSDLDFIERHIDDDKIIAVGEIGLDYHYEGYDKELQLEFFRKQLGIAEKYRKPVIVHSRDSINDTYNILKETKLRGILHCYSGSVEMALKFVEKGFCLGIGGVCTFKNAKTIIKVIEKVPVEFLQLETDAPYLTPEPYRGKRNESCYLSYVLKKISEIKGCDETFVLEGIRTGFFRVFDKSNIL